MRLVMCFFCIVAAAACPQPLGKVGCENVRDCAAGQVCTDNQCVAGAAGCTLDTDCDVNNNQVCDVATGTCKDGGDVTSGCQNTSECPISQFCNTSTGLCADLADGFCRNDTQCTTGSPVCSAASENVPGRCVECLTNDDCGGAQCVNPGVCSDINCPANATPINGACHCNPGFHQDVSGGCVANSTGEGEGEGDTGPGEGEGDTGGPGPDCDPAAAESGLICLFSGPYNSCDAATSKCACEPIQLLFTCVIGGGDANLETCDCDPPAEGEGEGEGDIGGEGEGEGDATAPATNVPCARDSDCDPGAICVNDGDPDLNGACKESCATSADCHNGVQCQVDVFGPGQGYCGNARIKGQTCEGSIFGRNWRLTDNFCQDPANATDDAPLACVDGICQDVCDSEFNTGAALSCPANQTCGPVDGSHQTVDLDGNNFPPTQSASVGICE